MCVRFPGESHTAQAHTGSAQSLSLFAQAMGPALIGSGQQPLSYQEMCQEARDREGRSDAMSGLGITCRGSCGELLRLARTQGRKLESSGKMASAQAEPRSRDSCRQQKPLQLVSTQSDLLLDLGDLKHVRRESPGASPGALPPWEAVTFS